MLIEFREKKMRRALAALLIVFFTVVCAQAGSVVMEVKGNYFYPREKAFKDIYGGGLVYGTARGDGVG